MDVRTYDRHAPQREYMSNSPGSGLDTPRGRLSCRSLYYDDPDALARSGFGLECASTWRGAGPHGSFGRPRKSAPALAPEEIRQSKRHQYGTCCNSHTLNIDRFGRE